MFDGLKKYKVVKSFNGYREGITVAFNGADAQKYADFIVSANAPKIAPVVEKVVDEVKVQEQAETPVKKTVKRVKKGRK